MRDVLEDTCLLELVLLFVGDLALDHTEEDLREAQSLVLRLADDEVAHHIGAGLGDRAAVSVEGGVLDHIVRVDLDIEYDVVAAARVDALEGVGCVLHLILVGRMNIMVRQDLVVKCNRHQ